MEKIFKYIDKETLINTNFDQETIYISLKKDHRQQKHIIKLLKKLEFEYVSNEQSGIWFTTNKEVKRFIQGEVEKLPKIKPTFKPKEKFIPEKGTKDFSLSKYFIPIEYIHKEEVLKKIPKIIEKDFLFFTNYVQNTIDEANRIGNISFKILETVATEDELIFLSTLLYSAISLCKIQHTAKDFINGNRFKVVPIQDSVLKDYEIFFDFLIKKYFGMQHNFLLESYNKEDHLIMTIKLASIKLFEYYSFIYDELDTMENQELYKKELDFLYKQKEEDLEGFSNKQNIKEYLIHFINQYKSLRDFDNDENLELNVRIIPILIDDLFELINFNVEKKTILIQVSLKSKYIKQLLSIFLITIFLISMIHGEMSYTQSTGNILGSFGAFFYGFIYNKEREIKSETIPITPSTQSLNKEVEEVITYLNPAYGFNPIEHNSTIPLFHSISSNIGKDIMTEIKSMEAVTDREYLAIIKSKIDSSKIELKFLLTQIYQPTLSRLTTLIDNTISKIDNNLRLQDESIRDLMEVFKKYNIVGFEEKAIEYNSNMNNFFIRAEFENLLLHQSNLDQMQTVFAFQDNTMNMDYPWIFGNSLEKNLNKPENLKTFNNLIINKLKIDDKNFKINENESLNILREKIKLLPTPKNVQKFLLLAYSFAQEKINELQPETKDYYSSNFASIKRELYESIIKVIKQSAKGIQEIRDTEVLLFQTVSRFNKLTEDIKKTFYKRTIYEEIDNFYTQKIYSTSVLETLPSSTYSSHRTNLFKTPLFYDDTPSQLEQYRNTVIEYKGKYKITTIKEEILPFIDSEKREYFKKNPYNEPILKYEGINEQINIYNYYDKIRRTFGGVQSTIVNWMDYITSTSGISGFLKYIFLAPVVGICGAYGTIYPIYLHYYGISPELALKLVDDFNIPYWSYGLSILPCCYVIGLTGMNLYGAVEILLKRKWYPSPTNRPEIHTDIRNLSNQLLNELPNVKNLSTTFMTFSEIVNNMPNYLSPDKIEIIRDNLNNIFRNVNMNIPHYKSYMRTLFKMMNLTVTAIFVAFALKTGYYEYQKTTVTLISLAGTSFIWIKALYFIFDFLDKNVISKLRLVLDKYDDIYEKLKIQPIIDFFYEMGDPMNYFSTLYFDEAILSNEISIEARAMLRKLFKDAYSGIVNEGTLLLPNPIPLFSLYESHKTELKKFAPWIDLHKLINYLEISKQKYNLDINIDDVLYLIIFNWMIKQSFVFMFYRYGTHITNYIKFPIENIRSILISYLPLLRDNTSISGEGIVNKNDIIEMDPIKSLLHLEYSLNAQQQIFRYGETSINYYSNINIPQIFENASSSINLNFGVLKEIVSKTIYNPAQIEELIQSIENIE